MKNPRGIIAFAIALLTSFNPLAQAQVYFDTGSAKPKNVEDATRDSV